MILNASAENGSLSSGLRVITSPVCGFLPLTSTVSRGEGRKSTTASSKGLDALVLESGADHHRKQLQPDRSTCAEKRAVRLRRSPRPRGTCAGSRHRSATVSTSCVWKASAFLRSSAGISSVTYSAPMVSSFTRCLHLDQIHNTLELVFLTDGNLNGDGLGVEALADGVDGMLEIRTHLVDLVDEANSRDAVFVGLPPDFFRLRLHAVHRVKYRDGAVEHAQRALHFCREIDVAGRINDVDADIAQCMSPSGAASAHYRSERVPFVRKTPHRRVPGEGTLTVRSGSLSGIDCAMSAISASTSLIRPATSISRRSGALAARARRRRRGI